MTIFLQGREGEWSPSPPTLDPLLTLITSVKSGSTNLVGQTANCSIYFYYHILWNRLIPVNYFLFYETFLLYNRKYIYLSALQALDTVLSMHKIEQRNQFFCPGTTKDIRNNVKTVQSAKKTEANKRNYPFFSCTKTTLALFAKKFDWVLFITSKQMQNKLLIVCQCSL